jgi:BirA family biotin operon repressor/biotin-[acetyl-CoA-carboxylase] ligase
MAARGTNPPEWAVVRLAETGSTNDDLLRMARDGAPARTVVVADHQTAGRGRLDRRWEAPPGANLLASLLFRPVDTALHRCTWAVALAARAACAQVVRVVPDLKWPNDLLVGGRKLAGVLAESSHGAVVVGIGLNVGWAPDGATSLAAEVASERPQPMEVLEAMFPVIDRLMACDDVELAVEYRAALATIGTEVRVDRVGLEPLVGRAVDVRDDGLLVIATVHGEVKVSAGDVVHLRPT